MEGWRTLLAAAAGSEFYRRHVREMNRAFSAPDEAGLLAALRYLPDVELSYFFEHFPEFHTADGETASAQPCSSVWLETARVAVVCPWFRVEPPARVYTRCEAEEIRKQAPEVIAMPVEVLERLLLEPEPLAALDLFSIVAFVGAGTPVASEELRDRVWRLLGVPLYIQLRGFHGELLARECELHDGLHIAAGAAAFDLSTAGELLVTSLKNLRHPVLRLATRLEAGIAGGKCACGSSEARLVALRPMPARAEGSLRALAAAVGSSHMAVGSGTRMLS